MTPLADQPGALLDAASDDPSARAELAARARAIRDAAWGDVVTYSRKVFIPLTRLCRDECGYCVFVRRPGQPGAGYMTPDEILAVAEQGRALGCKEALFSLGERPELRYPEARDALAALGYARTTDYVRDMCRLVVERTGLLPHVNAGTLTDEELAALRPVTGSMGMMLESVSARLLRRGQAHHRCPDKVPARRLETLEAAGRQRVPFTTGILIGIGETWAERLETLRAIEASHRRHGHIQEVIVQNFRAKAGTAMADHPEPGPGEMTATLAAARVILDPAIGVQAPPNLNEAFADYLHYGLSDWGGISPVTRDHINPERAWPQIARLSQVCAAHGFRLQERLTLYPSYVRQLARHADPGLAPAIRELARDDGLAQAQCLS